MEMDNMNEMGEETGNVAYSKKADSYKVMDNSMTWYNNQIERNMGREGGNMRWTNEWKGETGKDTFSKKTVTYNKWRQIMSG